MDGGNPLRICLIFSAKFPPEEGIGNYVNGLASHLQLRGHEVVGITRGSAFGTDVIHADGFQILKVPFIPAYPFHVQLHSLAVKKAIASLSGGVDVFHVHSPLSPVPPETAPIVSTFHTMTLQDLRYIESGGLRALLNTAEALTVSSRIETKLIQRSTRMTAVSAEVRDSLARYGVQPQGVEVVYNGVDSEVFSPGSGSSSPGQILYVGRFDLRKGLFDLLSAVKFLHFAGMRLVMVGKGPLESVLKARIRALGLEDRVELRGYVPRKDLVHLYQASEVFVLPSRYEGLPTVLLEAMACGTACVSTTVGGVPELVKQSVNGILVPPADPEALAAAIQGLHEDSRTRSEIGREARRRIVSRFSWQSIAANFERIYLEALGGDG